MAATEQIVLSVPEISCEHCVHAIDGSLGAMPGIERVSTDIPSRTVALTFDPTQISLDQIASALDEIGYTIAP